MGVRRLLGAQRQTLRRQLNLEVWGPGEGPRLQIQIWSVRPGGEIKKAVRRGRKRNKKRVDKEKTNSVVDPNASMSVITLKIDGLNTPAERQRLSE